MNALEVSAFTDAQLAGYEKFWDIISVEKTLISSAERKGRAEGMEKGLQKGKAEGKAEGRQEEKHSIALNLKKLGVSIEQIAFATGLSIEEIEKL